MKNINKVTLLFAALIFIKCSVKENIIDSIVLDQYQRCEENISCVIDFNEQLKYGWDKMYYFSSSLSLEEINDILELDLENYTDVGDRIVLLKKNKIVLEVEWFNIPSNNNKIKNSTIFKIHENYALFKPDKAKFRIERENNYLTLIPID